MSRKLRCLLLTALFLCVPGAAFASWHSVMQRSLPGGGPVMMVTPLLAQNGLQAPPNSATNYAGPVGGNVSGGSNWSTSVTITGKGFPMPVAGNITNLQAFAGTTIATGTYAIGVYKNYVLTAVVCSANIAVGVQLCSDTTHSVAFAPGDIFALGEVPSGTPTTSSWFPMSVLFTSTVGQESPVFWGYVGVSGPTTTLGFHAIQAVGSYGSDAARSTVMPTAGTFDTLYAQQSAITSAGATFSYFLYKNGAQTALTCAIAAGASTCNTANGVNQITVAAGDTVSIEMCPSTAGAPLDTNCVGSASVPTAVAVRGSLRWIPSTQNEAIVAQVSSTVPVTTATRNVALQGAGLSGDSSTGFNGSMAPLGMTIKKLWHTQDVAPGGATTRTLTLQGGQSGTLSGVVGSATNEPLTCTVASAGTITIGTGSIPGCTDLTHTYSPVVNEFSDLQTTVSGTNAAVTWFKNSAVVTIP